MANLEHVAILEQGVEVWNRWRKKNAAVIPDLTNATLKEMNLIGINLAQVNLSSADLTGSNLTRSILGEANLRKASLRRTNLTWADLGRAILDQVDFTGALLDHTRFRLRGTDLLDAIGLHSLRYSGNVLLSFDSQEEFYRMGPRLPEELLLKSSFPQRLIAEARRRAMRFHSCFISFAFKDQTFAEQLYKDLRAQGVPCWFAPHDIGGGRKIYEQLDEAIRKQDRLLLILSEASMSSEWVKTEIANARQREIQEGRQMLFPITVVPFEKIRNWRAFDADTGKDSAREIREYFIPDFSNWKDHDSYSAALQRLLSDLRAEDGSKPK